MSICNIAGTWTQNFHFSLCTMFVSVWICLWGEKRITSYELMFKEDDHTFVLKSYDIKENSVLQVLMKWNSFHCLLFSFHGDSLFQKGIFFKQKKYFPLRDNSFKYEHCVGGKNLKKSGQVVSYERASITLIWELCRAVKWEINMALRL